VSNQNWIVLVLTHGLLISSHNTETTHWLDPRLMRQLHHDPLECSDDGNMFILVYIS